MIMMSMMMMMMSMMMMMMQMMMTMSFLLRCRAVIRSNELLELYIV